MTESTAQLLGVTRFVPSFKGKYIVTKLRIGIIGP